MKKSKLIIFDIDKTLFSTEEMRGQFRNRVLSELKIEEQIFLRSHELANNIFKNRSDFKPERYLQDLSPRLKRDYKKLLKLYYLSENFEKSLYPEVKEVIEQLKKNYQLGIFSEGFKRYQHDKLKHSGLIDHFQKEHIYIHRRKLKIQALKALPKNSLIVDDNLEVVEALLKEEEKQIVWINRKDTKSHPKAVTIFNLKEIHKILS